MSITRTKQLVRIKLEDRNSLGGWRLRVTTLMSILDNTVDLRYHERRTKEWSHLHNPKREVTVRVICITHQVATRGLGPEHGTEVVITSLKRVH